MQYSGDQLSKIGEAKAAGQERTVIYFTDEQKREYQRAIEQEVAAQGENIVHFRKIKSASERPGFFGDIRRAILVSRRPVDKLASEIGVAPQLLSDFRAGDGELPAAALDLLMATLGLRLMQEIPR